LHFGSAAVSRFDDPQREFGVLYVAEDIWCAFVETFGQETGITHDFSVLYDK
jgi:hypothetical protein